MNARNDQMVNAFQGLQFIILGQEGTTTTSDPSTATLLYPATGQSSASRICRMRAKNHLGPGLRACCTCSLDTVTAWPYLPPGIPHANDPGDELEDAVGGGEHAARERESERSE